MHRELLLLRHGKSDWTSGCDDFNRPLKNRGKRGAQRIGVWLQQHKLEPDYILSSPAERALSTAQKCCKAMGMAASGITCDARVYLADLTTLLACLAECPASARRILLVGHNPGLEDLLMHLADAPIKRQEDGKLLTTATLAHLRLSKDWHALGPDCGHLHSIARARSLESRFPFPGPGDKERRDRPAYYYTQSSVIPYRIRNGVVEILLIGSSKKKHWVVPKGIADPGMSPQASACKEALEEAGVEGQIVGPALGEYAYEKWGGSCHCTVYAMQVTRVLEAHEWEERHRERQWLPANQAIQLVKQSALRPMIADLARHLRED